MGKAIDFKAIDYHMNQVQLCKVKGVETLFLDYTRKPRLSKLWLCTVGRFFLQIKISNENCFQYCYSGDVRNRQIKILSPSRDLAHGIQVILYSTMDFFSLFLKVLCWPGVVKIDPNTV